MLFFSVFCVLLVVIDIVLVLFIFMRFCFVRNDEILFDWLDLLMNMRWLFICDSWYIGWVFIIGMVRVWIFYVLGFSFKVVDGVIFLFFIGKVIVINLIFLLVGGLAFFFFNKLDEFDNCRILGFKFRDRFINNLFFNFFLRFLFNICGEECSDEFDEEWMKCLFFCFVLGCLWIIMVFGWGVFVNWIMFIGCRFVCFFNILFFIGFIIWIWIILWILVIGVDDICLFICISVGFFWLLGKIKVLFIDIIFWMMIGGWISGVDFGKDSELKGEVE